MAREHRNGRCPSTGARRVKDPCCVLTSELARFVRDFTERWSREHVEGSQHGTRGKLSATRILHERTRLAGGCVSEDTIRNVLLERNRTTELWIADALLCAVHETGALLDGRVLVGANLEASAAARREAGRRGMVECESCPRCGETARHRPRCPLRRRKCCGGSS